MTEQAAEPMKPAQPARQYTPAEIELGIHAALEAGDMEAVVGLMRLLAVRDPKRAEALLIVINAGIAISRREREANR